MIVGQGRVWIALFSIVQCGDNLVERFLVRLHLSCKLTGGGIKKAVEDDLKEQIVLEQGLRVGVAGGAGFDCDGAGKRCEPAPHGGPGRHHTSHHGRLDIG